MTLRTARSNRLLAWTGLLAIVLLSIVPTISRVVAYTSQPLAAATRSLADNATAETGHTCKGDHRAGHADHDAPLSSNEHASAHCRHGDKPGEDCWHKCGYCDFLTHTPALGSFEFFAHFATALPPVLVPRTLAQSTHAAYFPAAQPRGPPLL
jgi:hypothetical protein